MYSSIVIIVSMKRNTLTRSPLGRQIIIYLVQNMHNLRTLIVKYTERNNDDLIPWLKLRLPPTCLITDDLYDEYRISIWV